MRNYKLPIAPASVWLSTLLLNFLGLAMPLAVLQIFGRVIPNNAIETLTVMMAGLVGVAFVEFLLREARSRHLQYQATIEQQALCVELCKTQLFADPMSTEKASARKRLRQMQASFGIADTLNGTGRLHVIELPFAFIALGCVWLIAGPLVFVPLTGFLLLCIAALFMRFHQSEALGKRTEADEDRYDFWAHVLGNIMVAKTAQMEAGLRAKYQKFQGRSSAASLAAIRSASLFENLSTVANYSFASATVLVGAFFVISGNLGPAELAACTMLSARAVQPALQVIRYWAAGESSKKVLQDVREGLSTPVFKDNAAPDEELSGHIVFNEVTTRTSRTGRATLRRESFEIPAQTLTALSSSSRSAPDAVMRLLLGEAVPDVGEVFLDGYDPRSIMHCRGTGGIVFIGQKPTILDATIIENIAGVIEAENISRAYAVADSIGISDFVNSLPYGFDTHMRESGMHESSTGFLQMINVARAVAQSPSVLLMADSCSALDHATRRRVYRALKEQFAGASLIAYDSAGIFDAYAGHRVELRSQSGAAVRKDTDLPYTSLQRRAS